ncbi:hypothetical protein PGTUg99_000428 [Puccinia graminis f. sp. tritici]|uniref:ML-like domain-containing protein n=1 Tax=Puccinia graminis f. sp. tritici TaxID=56615 RepID=A0A5B0NCI7_PUCGR|nr:hypothetical protein PGTUg99_000428 [Puccinia graminis f. sp. tritici]
MGFLSSKPNHHPYSRWIALTLICLSQLTTLTLAGSEIIETSSVSYCSDPLAILVDTFDVRYSKLNSTLDFDLSAASVTRGLNLEAQLNLNAYGIHALNLSIDLCSVLSGVLCPLPTYNFTGSGQYSIPASRIPSIPALAWSVPDIEAVFTIELIDSSSRQAAACLQVTLTNGLTVGHKSVAWVSAAFLILSALIALGAAIIPLLCPAHRPCLLLLSPRKPTPADGHDRHAKSELSLLRTWTTNFAYSVGLISSRAISRAIDDLRDRTGGNGFKTTQDTVAFISRLYSPFNQQRGTVDTHTDTSSSARALFVKDTMHQLISGAYQNAPAYHNSTTSPSHHLVARQALDSSGFVSTVPRPRHTVPVVTRNTTLLDPGLAAYVNKVGFPVENAFMFLFMWLLILTAFFLACFLLTSLVLLIIPSRTRSPLQKLVRLSPVSLAIGLRALLFVYPPLSLLPSGNGASAPQTLVPPSSSASSSGSVPRSPSASSVGVSSAITLVDTLELVRRPRRHVQACDDGRGPVGDLAIPCALLGDQADPRTVLGFGMIAVHTIGFLAVIIFGGWPLIGELRTVLGDRLAVVDPEDREKISKEDQDLMAERNHSMNRMTLTDSHEHDHDARLSQPSPAEDATLTLNDDDHPLYLVPDNDHHQALKDHLKSKEIKKPGSGHHQKWGIWITSSELILSPTTIVNPDSSPLVTIITIIIAVQIRAWSSGSNV